MCSEQTRIGASLCFLNFLPLWAAMVLIDLASLYRQGWGWQNGGAEWCALGGIVAGCMASVVMTKGWLAKISGAKCCNEEGFCLKRIEARKTLTSDVLMTYVLPLLAFDFTKWTGLGAFLIFLMVVLWLAAKHGVISGSLYLEFRGFHGYEIRMAKPGDDKGLGAYVLSREELEGEEGAYWEMGKLNDQTFFAVRRI